MSGRRTNGTGAVYQNKERGTWIGEAVIDGKRRRVTARTKVDASAKLNRLIVDGERGVAVVDGSTTVDELLTMWTTRELAGRPTAPGTADLYNWTVGLLRAELGTVRLRRLDVDRVEKAIDRIATGTVGASRGKPLSRRTLKTVRSTLAQALDFGIKRKLIASNPARLAALTPTAAKQVDRRSLAVKEATILWDALATERIGNLVKVMLTTGLRPGEALGLCWDAVDLELGRAEIHRAVRVENNRSVLVGTLKTASSYRTIGLAQPTIDALRAQRVLVAETKLASRVWALDDQGLVFPTAQGTPWNLSNLRTELTEVCGRAGITPPLRPHELRHSAASLLNDAGVPIEQIADLLGHDDASMLLSTYRHRLRPSADAAVAVMGNLFGASAVR